MSKEEKLKEYILSKYGSLREFTLTVNMPYSTLTSVLKRGIDNASISNIVKICRSLGISADSLADGEIVPIINRQANDNERLEINEIISQTANRLMLSDNVTLDGKPINKDVVESIVEAMDVGVEIVKRKKR